ncbi:MAG: hypothetical protein KGP35_04600 [Bacteroidetes bacterium]|nr:hypothetical protein [Bacteroidota bacterium]
MKKLFLLSFFIFPATFLKAQEKPKQESLRETVQAVLRAAAEDFIEIRGEALMGEPGTKLFASTIYAPNSLENKILGYEGLKKTDWVWESKLRIIENTEDLAKEYKKIYQELKGVSLKTLSKSYEPVLSYEHPNTSRRIWTNQFKVVGKQLMIDLVAENSDFEWVIWLRVYDKSGASK